MTLLTPEICERARQARDPRFDGRFYVGVLTTGIYCRPVCPARTPKSENVRFFPSGAAAQTAGFRPCMRCKPDLNAPASSGQQVSTPLLRALRHIEAGFLNAGTTTALAAELGLGARQLNRLFADELGTTPLAVGRAVRLQLARRLMTNPSLRLTEVAMHAGFGSIRRFNAEFQAVYQQPPGVVRQQLTSVAGESIRFSVPIREPYHRPWMMDFLAARTLDGMESVVDGVYRRRIIVSGGGVGHVAAELGANGLHVTIPAHSEMPAHAILRRLRRVFDLDADGAAIDEQLRGDPWLVPWLEAAQGCVFPAHGTATKQLCEPFSDSRSVWPVPEPLRSCSSTGSVVVPSPQQRCWPRRTLRTSVQCQVHDVTRYDDWPRQLLRAICNLMSVRTLRH